MVNPGNQTAQVTHKWKKKNLLNSLILDFYANSTFKDTSTSEFYKLAKTLNIRKASQKINFPIKIIELNADFGNYMWKNFSYCLE